MHVPVIEEQKPRFEQTSIVRGCDAAAVAVGRSGIPNHAMPFGQERSLHDVPSKPFKQIQVETRDDVLQ